MTAASTLITPFGTVFDTAVLVGVAFVLLAVALSRLGTSAEQRSQAPKEQS